MNQKQRCRESNFEFLRILCMLLIIAFHLKRHFVIEETELSAQIVWRAMTSWGIMSVDCFVILGSWFMTEQRVNTRRKIVEIMGQVLTYSFVFAVLHIVRNIRLSGVGGG